MIEWPRKQKNGTVEKGRYTLIDTVLFDLDGTLLPMDQDLFVQTYLGLLADYLEPAGYDPKRLVRTVWQGTGAMMKNDGTRTNEEVFWEVFRQAYGQKADTDRELVDEFYAGEFANARRVCGYAPEAAELIAELKARGIRLILATNPLFPRMATLQRIRWAGLNPQDFELVTTYENSCFCKPNPAYFREILEKTGLTPDRCLMIGNDAREDLAAAKLGMEVFLLEEGLLNREALEEKPCRTGSYEDLKQFLREMLDSPLKTEENAG